MKISPAVFREDFWGDLANTLLLRPVYRETKQEHAAKAAESASEHAAKAAESKPETEQTEEGSAAVYVSSTAESTAAAAALAAVAATDPQAAKVAASMFTEAGLSKVNQAVTEAFKTLGGYASGRDAVVTPSSEDILPTAGAGRHVRVFPEVSALFLPSSQGRILPTSEAVLKGWNVSLLAGINPSRSRRLIRAVDGRIQRIGITEAASMSKEATATVGGSPESSQTQESVAFYRGLYAAEPDERLGWSLADALLNHARALADEGKTDAAVDAAAEAVGIFRSEQLTGDSRAAALNAYADMLTAVGREDEAAKLGVEAMKVYEELFEKYPKAYEPGLVAAEITLSERQSRVGAHELAIATAADAVARSRKMEAEIPSGHTADLALALVNYSERLLAAGEARQALETLSEAVELYVKLAELFPVSYTPQLTMLRDLLAQRGGKTKLPDMSDDDAGPESSQ